jgi:alpha/beta hydrolase family protein
MDYTTLKSLKPTEFEGAADGYRATGDMAQAAKDHIENVVAVGMRKSLEGEAADAAQKQLQALSKNFHYTQTECGVISTALNGFAYDLAAAKRKLESAVADAPADFTVNANGSVTYPEGPDKVDGKIPHGGTANGTTTPLAQGINRQAAQFDPNPYYARAQAIADRITAALEEATAADEKWAPKLRALKADDDLTVSARDWTDVTSDTGGVRKAADHYLDTIKGPPKSDWPQDNANWWKGLPEEERAAYVSMNPASVGALNGLPADVRDEANRVVLAEQRGATQSQLDAWLKKEPEHYRPYISPITGREVKGASVPTEEWKKWNETKGQIEGPLKGMDAIQSRFDNYTSESTRPYLLGFDNNKLGHAIVSIGNPDTADNVVTYVPGTGSKLESIDGDIRRAELLQTKAERTDPAHSTSSILWLGYDAPQSIMGDAMDAKWADKAQEPLSNFLTGIEEANSGDVNSTVLGHSYGTLVAGQTMRDNLDLPVDNAIMVGSPGVGVDHAKDLNIPADHVWAGTAKNDLINLAPPPAGPLAPLNPKAYMELFDDHSILYGNDPVSDEFGGRTFHVPDGKLAGTDGLMPAHSQYWEGDSLENMAKIVTGGQP